MKLTHLELHNFRNYFELELDCHPALNIFLGQNAQGKTNILESIFFLALTRSHRTSHDRDLIRWSADSLSVKGELETDSTTLPLEVQLTAKNRIALINHLREPKLADYIGHLNVVLFAPEDLDLLKGAPNVRRRFLNMEISQAHSLYIYDLLRYNHALRERNAALKMAAIPDETLLDVLDAQLAEHGEKVMAARSIFVEKIASYATNIHRQLTKNTEALEILYKQNSTQLTEDLAANRQKDVAHRQTSVGPHRDDLQFFVNGINVADFGSQGQQRTVILSLKLAEIDLIHEETGEYPILLLDDVMSELDNSRQLELLNATLGKTQTFLTTTTLDHLQNLPDNLSIFTVNQGQIIEQ